MCCCSTALRAAMGASVMSTNGVDGPRCASRMTRGKLALHYSKGLKSSGVWVIQVMG
jgi:hypothetical protein